MLLNDCECAVRPKVTLFWKGIGGGREPRRCVCGGVGGWGGGGGEILPNATLPRPGR